MSSEEQLSLKKFDSLVSQNPSLMRMLERISVSTYEDFVDLLYDDLDWIVQQIQRNPELRQDDGEDRLTIEIVLLLNTQGYKASHDTKVGGHVDLLVEKDRFMWIGEAKVHSGYDYLWEGFLQLATRYSIGSSNQSHGGMLIYIRRSNTRNVMEKWRQTLSQKSLEDFSSEDCTRNSLAFFSSHKHERSGLPLRVRHMPVMLYFEPKDKSARKRQKNASA
ncbi:hypothetical protein C1752_08259 [Acaryochloris thomasi RCC1774]|uniref:Uncharacterized protein n=1 Tax=Acaryochloris thomasi RCC1774 TaxID=1764569 RepID=A0A2W1JAP3_9CYAN|nr:hypothetical protein [Acaryochloris thomasi]PZD71056.1 hypothetical protein C1752_08259 [Acaryochloris thomasi RCC1774]